MKWSLSLYKPWEYGIETLQYQVKRINIFLIFGILSAIFLFLHVYFLGQKYEAEIFNEIRRSYIVFFILFEILAQAYLLKIIWKKRNDLKNYFYRSILISKLSFVIFVALSTFTILTILIFNNLSSKVDYISLSPFKKTIYLDTDIIVVKKIDTVINIKIL